MASLKMKSCFVRYVIGVPREFWPRRGKRVSQRVSIQHGRREKAARGSGFLLPGGRGPISREIAAKVAKGMNDDEFRPTGRPGHFSERVVAASAAHFTSRG